MNKTDGKITKQVGLAVLVVVVVLAAVAGAVYYQKNYHNDTEVTLSPKDAAVKAYGDKDYDKAITQVDDLISSAPQDADNYNFKANILRDKGDIAGAAENYNKSIELNPHVLAPYVNAANMYINQGDKASAEAIITKGLKEFPGQKALTQLQAEIK